MDRSLWVIISLPSRTSSSRTHTSVCSNVWFARCRFCVPFVEFWPLVRVNLWEYVRERVYTHASTRDRCVRVCLLGEKLNTLIYVYHRPSSPRCLWSLDRGGRIRTWTWSRAWDISTGMFLFVPLIISLSNEYQSSFLPRSNSIYTNPQFVQFYTLSEMADHIVMLLLNEQDTICYL